MFVCSMLNAVWGNGLQNSSFASSQAGMMLFEMLKGASLAASLWS